jgi:hypothetical protein
MAEESEQGVETVAPGLEVCGWQEKGLGDERKNTAEDHQIDQAQQEEATWLRTDLHRRKKRTCSDACHRLSQIT